jgi:hypothetical protein
MKSPVGSSQDDRMLIIKNDVKNVNGQGIDSPLVGGVAGLIVSWTGAGLDLQPFFEFRIS